MGKYDDRHVYLLATGEESFSSRLPLLREAARKFGNDMALQQATWEPHDWSDF